MRALTASGDRHRLTLPGAVGPRLCVKGRKR